LVVLAGDEDVGFGRTKDLGNPLDLRRRLPRLVLEVPVVQGGSLYSRGSRRVTS